MTHPQQTTREALEQCVQALNHCMDAIIERGLNGSPDQAEKWGLQLPLARAESAITAARSVLANPTPSTAGERAQAAQNEDVSQRAFKAAQASMQHYRQTMSHAQVAQSTELAKRK